MTDEIRIVVGGTPPGEGRVDCSCSFEGRCGSSAYAVEQMHAELKKATRA